MAYGNCGNIWLVFLFVGLKDVLKSIKRESKKIFFFESEISLGDCVLNEYFSE